MVEGQASHGCQPCNAGDLYTETISMGDDTDLYLG